MIAVETWSTVRNECQHIPANKNNYFFSINNI